MSIIAGNPATSRMPWQQDWLDNFPCDMPSSVPYPRGPLTLLLDRAAQLYPTRDACTLYGKGTTFARLNDQAHRLATALREMGAGKGRCVGILLPNIPEYLATLQAVWLTGATALQISPLMVAEEVSHWLKASDCRIVVTLDLLVPTVIGALGHGGPLEHIVLTSLASRLAVWKGLLYRLERYRRSGFLRLPEDARWHSWDHVIYTSTAMAEGAKVDPAEDVAVLAPTGGTTSSPKAVELTHRNLMANTMQLRHWVGGPDGGGVLGVLPFFHCYGLTVSLLASWARGSTLHLYPRFDARPVLDVMVAQKPDVVPAVPAMLHALSVQLKAHPADLSFVQHVISGASALTASVREEFQQFGAHNLVEGYGLTEASPVTHVNPPGEGNRPGTIGILLPDTEARLVDSETGAAVEGIGGVGELVVRGPQVMKGYHNNPEATAAALRDGWLFTGDIARRETDGYFAIVDRKRDIIKTSGFLVFPAEVEEVLRGFSGVAEAAVVGQPDEERGELVKALVVPRNGHLDLSALTEYCREHLGKHKRPRKIEVVPELPKNFLGKVLRRKLRDTGAAANGS